MPLVVNLSNHERDEAPSLRPRPGCFASLSMKAWPSVILSEAKDLSGAVVSVAPPTGISQRLIGLRREPAEFDPSGCRPPPPSRGSAQG